MCESLVFDNMYILLKYLTSFVLSSLYLIICRYNGATGSYVLEAAAANVL